MFGDVTLSLTLNGTALGTVEGTGDKDLQTSFDATPGLNTLDLAWKPKASGTEFKASFVFYAMR
jgi:hypothetical protein